jgi:hephaestin
VPDKVLLLSSGLAVSGWHRAGYVPRTRVYFVAAEEVVWNYAPTRVDPGPWGRKTRYPKGRFITRTPEAPAQGILGPMIRGVVGDPLKIVLWNKSQMPVSLHAHGTREHESGRSGSRQPGHVAAALPRQRSHHGGDVRDL